MVPSTHAHILLILFGCLLLGRTSTAQGTYIPLGYDDYHVLDRFEIKYGTDLENRLHTVAKPYSRPAVMDFVGELRDLFELENKVWQYQLRHFNRDNPYWAYRNDPNWRDSIEMRKKPILKIFYQQPAFLYSVHTKDFQMQINPVLQFELGAESAEGSLKFMNTRGAEIRGNVLGKVGYYFYLGENQWRGNRYVQDWIQRNEAVPGEGFYKEFRTTAVDYFTARGYIDFNFLKYFSVQFGHNRFHIGNGYRSLFLSDFGNNFFFLKLNAKVWRINYQTIFAELVQQYDRGVDQLLPRKYAAFHHLNFHIARNFELGLFEGVIFNREGGFELQYLNPLIFYRSIEQQIGSPDNAFVGLDFKANVWKRFSIYGQFLLDEFNFSHIAKADGWWANKWGLQAGVKYIDVFGIRNLDGQIEFNTVRPYTYTHNTTANFSHYNQPLAHPLGANFKELILSARYQPIPRLVVNGRYHLMSQGVDTSGSHWGSNILLPTISPLATGSLLERELDNRIGQGVATTTHFLQLLASYEVKHNIFFDLRILARMSSNSLGTDNTVGVNLGARMNLPYRSQVF